MSLIGSTIGLDIPEPMSFLPEEWARVRTIFEEALALAPAHRRAHIDTACGGDPDLRRHVERLLASHEEVRTDFLEGPATESVRDAVNGPLLDGRRIGPYEISTRIGAGGMGVVYKARDTRLNRIVVLKVISSHLIDAPGARERFDREARAVGALNHPNICTLHDIGHDAGIDYLVMEHLEGETLAARLEKGPLPIPRAIEYGIAMARALDRAHRAGIVHRDLKPANVMLTKAGLKLLDFGVAQTQDGPAAASADTSVADLHLTTPGAVLGTVQYMSPEQILGNRVDARSDVFAFGLVLYQMLTGRKAFAGDTRASLVATILEQDPASVSSLRAGVPPFLDRIVMRSLARDPDERWQSTADLALALESVGAAATTSAGPNGSPRLRTVATLGWMVAASLAVLAAWLWERPVDNPRTRLMRLSMLPPDGTTFLGGYGAPYLALSPDGTTLAFVPTPVGGRARIWIRPLDSLKASPLAGTEGATYPFWSPDGRSIGFFADNRLKVLDRLDSVPRVLCDAPEPRGGAWGSEGVLIFAPTLTGPLLRISVTGGTPTPAARLEAGETSHRFPTFLPDGRHFLYLVQTQSRDTNNVMVGSLDSPQTHRLSITGSRAVFADGFLVFDRDRTLAAQRFDPATFSLSGQPVSIGDRVAFRTTIQGDAPFAIAPNGTLVYWDGDEPLTALRWFDRSGHALSALGPPAQYASIALSRDERGVAAEVFDPSTQSADIWSIDASTGIRSRLTSGDTVNWGPIWSPDGARIAFGSLRKGGPSQIYVQDARGGAPSEPVFDSPDFVGATDWSADGRTLLLQNMTQLKVEALSFAALQAPALVLRSAFLEGDGRLSPDGRWLAYSSTESGSWDVYVQPYPTLAGKWRVSVDGGFRPVWRRDGRELFYVSPDQQLMAVPIAPGASLTPGTPSALFGLRTLLHPPTQARQPFAVSSDGQRFLVLTAVEPVSASPVTIILNWTAALRN